MKWEGRETGLPEGMHDRVGTWAQRIRHDNKTVAAFDIIVVFLIVMHIFIKLTS